MIRLGRTFAVALLLMALMPGMALAGESDDHPLASLPSEYAPALEAAAAQLGVSSEQLTSASGEELESLLCSKLDQSSVNQFAARATAALNDASLKDVENLSAAQHAQLEARLPSLIRELEAKYCTTAAGGDGVRTDVAAGSGADASGSAGSASGDAGSGGSAAAASGSGGSGSAASGSADSASGGAAAGTTSDSGIPVPNRVDTGGGGAADGQLLPLAFGGLFAALFGLFGVGVMRRQQDA